MAIPAYMSIYGTRQKQITENASSELSIGDGYQKGHENQVMLQSVSHNIIIPRDPQTGQPTGKRIHQPFIVTKGFDKSSPLLQVALTKGEVLELVVIEWYRPTSQGGRVHYYTTTLEGAILVSMTSFMHDCQDASKGHYSHMEELQFTYRKISWEHKLSNTTGQSDWRDPDE